MAKNVIILGAGASVDYGAPVMGNFLDVARRLFSSGKVGKRQESFRRVFEAISRLQAVHSKAEFDLINLESIFTAFELAKTLGRFPGSSADEIDQLIDDLKWVIVSTLQTQIRFPIKGGHISVDSSLEDFIRTIASRSESAGITETAILTFNYDLLIDMAIWRSETGVDYGLAKQTNCHSWVPLLKLHGSLNWTTNSETGDVLPWFLTKYLQRYTAPFHAAGDVAIPMGDHLSEYGQGKNEPEKVDGKPVIVPPSWNKADSHRAISKVWSRAAEELSNASSIYVVGYSLPVTDSFFRQLYALGTVGHTLLQRFWVFNPDKSREDVFRSMLGPGARERFMFSAIRFSEAIERIAESILEG